RLDAWDGETPGARHRSIGLTAFRHETTRPGVPGRVDVHFTRIRWLESLGLLVKLVRDFHDLFRCVIRREAGCNSGEVRQVTTFGWSINELQGAGVTLGVCLRSFTGPDGGSFVVILHREAVELAV